MQTLRRLLFQVITIILMAVGVLSVLIAGFITVALLTVWFHEGKLPEPDQKLFTQTSIFLLVGLLLLGSVRWSYFKTLGRELGDRSFRLVKSSSPKTEARAFRLSEILFFVMLAGWVGSSLSGNVISRIPFVIGWTFVGLLGSYLCIALHEFGHLGAAWCLKMKLQKFQVGAGPLIWSHRSPNGFVWEWRMWPYGGFTFAVPATTSGFRMRQFIFVAGGPFMDVLFLSLLYQVIARAFGGLGEAWTHGPCGIVLAIGFWRHAIAAGHGLVPLSFWVDNQPTWTDGYWIVRLLTGSRTAIEQLASATQMIEWLNLSPSDMGPKGQTPEGSDNLPSFEEQKAVLNSQLLRPQR